MIKYKMFFKFLISILLFVAAIDLTFACNGYKLEVEKITNCGDDDAIITVHPDFTVELTTECEVVPTGCVMAKAFTTAVAKYKIKKLGVVIKKGTVDLCGAAIPEQCAAPKQENCLAIDKVDVSKYKEKIRSTKGSVTVDLDITHDTGKSCFHIKLQIKKL